MTVPRVLLVEDDSSLRRFVRMALDELPIELIECDSVVGALHVLTQGPVELILTDLMMPGESGFGLLQSLKASPDLQAMAKVVVLSAGLNEKVREQLAPFSPWRLIDKPVPVSVLEECVNAALGNIKSAGKSTAEEAAGSKPTGPVSSPFGDSERIQAIQDYFEGDVELFQTYSAACMVQFPLDIQDGNAACEAGDLQALRRVTHSLKSVLLTLGYSALGAQARDIETLSAAGDAKAANANWPALVAQLHELIRGGDNRG